MDITKKKFNNNNNKIKYYNVIQLTIRKRKKRLTRELRMPI